MIAHLDPGNGRRFIGWHHFAIDRSGQANATNGAGVNDAPTACVSRCFEHISGPLHIGGVHWFIVLQPQMVARGDMKAPITPLQPLFEASQNSYVSIDSVVFNTAKSTCVA